MVLLIGAVYLLIGPHYRWQARWHIQTCMYVCMYVCHTGYSRGVGIYRHVCMYVCMYATQVIRAGHFTAVLRSRLISIVMIVCAEHECACVRARASWNGMPLSGNVLTCKPFVICQTSDGKLCVVRT